MSAAKSDAEQEAEAAEMNRAYEQRVMDGLDAEDNEDYRMFRACDFEHPAVCASSVDELSRRDRDESDSAESVGVPEAKVVL
jgi:hypothetical protein